MHRARALLVALAVVVAGLGTALAAGAEDDWKRERKLIWPVEFANPDIVPVQGGGFRAYLMSSEGIVSAFSGNGRDFEFEAGIRVVGQHHALARLPDGRLRIYYSTADSGGVISAVSEDGLNFTPEPGLRLAAKPGERPIHLHVVEVEGGWRMYYDADASSPGEAVPDWRGIRSAFSPDGLEWQRERGFRIRAGMKRLRSASLVWSPFAEQRRGRTKLYFAVETDKKPKKKAGIYRAVSKNGRKFKVARGGPELGVDPRVRNPTPTPGGLSGQPQDPFIIRAEGEQRLFYWQARAGNFSAVRR